MRNVLVATTAAAVALAAVTSHAADWLQFGYDANHSGTNSAETALSKQNVARLHLKYSLTLPGLVPGAPVLLAGVNTPEGTKDLLFLTVSDGTLLALDAATGATQWSRYPSTSNACAQPNASDQCTTATSPVLDPNRQFVYGYSLDGRVHKYTVADGNETTGGGWPEVVTLKPDMEQVSSALAFATAKNGTTYLYATVSGGAWLPEDSGDYQGHVTAINLATGTQVVFNVMCSDRGNVHFVENNPNPPNSVQPDCLQQQMTPPGGSSSLSTGNGGIWGRAGVVYDPVSDRIYVTTGNGIFGYDANNGGHNWSDSVIALPAAMDHELAAPLDSYTPSNYLDLMYYDTDLGSTSVVLVPAPAGSSRTHIGIQSGKDGDLRLLDLDDMSGTGSPGNTGGQIFIGNVPQGNEVKTQPIAWTNPATGDVMLIAVNNFGISAVRVKADPANGNLPTLQASGAPNWVNEGTPVHGSATSTGGTSPVLANGVLYYAGGSGVTALDPATGATLWQDGSMGVATSTASSKFHKQSVIVVGGRLYVADNGSKLWVYEGDVIFADGFQ